MNIQFMTKEKNGVPTGKVNYRGEMEYRFIPNFDEMIASASCEEEATAIKNIKERFEKDTKGIFAFPFEIVYMDYRDEWSCTEGFTGRKTWQMMQHPWYRDHNGVYDSRNQMIDEVAKAMNA